MLNIVLKMLISLLANFLHAVPDNSIFVCIINLNHFKIFSKVDHGFSDVALSMAEFKPHF